MKLLQRFVQSVGFLLLLFVVSGCFSNTAAADVLYSDQQNNVSWSIDSEGCLKIEGSGDYFGATWTSYGRKIVTRAIVSVKDITSFKGMFQGMENLQTVDFKDTDISKVTNMSGLFSRCTNLKEIKGNTALKDWDVSNVTTMSAMFNSCSSLEALDVSRWNVENVKDISGMFSGCQKLEELSVENWNTKSLVNMAGAFSDCAKFDLSDWDMSHVENLEQAFSGCGIQEFDGSKWNLKSLKTAKEMFSRADNIKKVNICFSDAKELTNLSNVFNRCGNLETVEFSGCPEWKLANSYHLFYCCGKLSNVKLLNWNTSSVKDMSGMFYLCSSLKELDLSGWDTANVTDMDCMFYYCKKLEKLDLSGWDTKNVTNMSNMFCYCSNLQKLEMSGWNTANVKNMSNMFYYCSNLQKLEVSGWDTENVTDMSCMFCGCSKLQKLELLGWKTGNVNSISSIFSGCYSIVSLDLGTWDGSNFTNIKELLRDCKKLQKLVMFPNAKEEVVLPEIYTAPYWVDENNKRCETTAAGLKKAMTYQGVKVSIEKGTEKNVSSIFQSDTAEHCGYRYDLYAVYPEVAYLQKTKQGYERVEVKETQGRYDFYTIDGSLVIEEYDENYEFLSAKELSLELPRFGGCYLGQDYNFVICGQENKEEDNAKEVIRIIRYSKEWKRLDSASLYGINTYIPFDAGKVSCAQKEGLLYVRTTHEKYSGASVVHHQSSMSFILDIETMKFQDAFYDTSNIDAGEGYVSHSFNQFVLADGEDIITLDHGDAHPRAAVLCKFSGIQSSFTGGIPTELLTFRGEEGDNYTDAALGGLSASDSSYLVAGNYLRKEEDSNRSIFLSVVPKNQTENHQLIYLTDGKEAVSMPKLVKINSNRFLILWNIEGKSTQSLQYVFVDGQGKKLTDIITAKKAADLSDCQPIVSENKVVWYSTRNSVPHFYEIDIDTKTISVTDAHYDTTLGDLDQDGSINSADALMVLKIAANLKEPTSDQQKAADINKDGKVNAADALLILKRAAGLITEF